MALTNEFNPFIVAADTANMQAGAELSLLDQARNLTATAMVSGVASIYNTAAHYIGFDKVDVEKWLENQDAGLASYYRDNKGLADTVGFVATSLIPGGIALKGLQLAKAGTMLGPFSRVLGFASRNQQYYVEQGLKELAIEGGTVFDSIRKSKLAAMGWATADQMLSVAAFETAVAITMKQSPLLEQDSIYDIGKHTLLTSLAFGTIGGAVESIAIHSIFKAGTKKIDAALNAYRTLTSVEGDLAKGDKAYGILSSMLDLPAEAKNLEFTYRLAGKDNKLELPTKEAIEKTRTSTEQRAWEEFRTLSNTLAEGDTEVGQSFARFVEQMVVDARTNGVPVPEIKDRLRDHLANVGKVTRVTDKASLGSDDLFYIPEKLTKEQIAKISNFSEFVSQVARRSPSGNDTTRVPYRMLGDGGDVNVGLVGLSNPQIPGRGLPRFQVVEEAWDAGLDAVVTGKGTVLINPKSKKFIKVDDPVVTPRSYFNTRTGAFADTAYPTAADIASTAKPLRMTAVDHLVSGGRNWTFNPLDEFKLVGLDSIDASARYVYAHELKVVPQKIYETDIPMLEKIFQAGADNHKDVILLSVDGSEKKVGEILDFPEWLKVQKLTLARNRLEEGTEDITALALKMNVEPSWLMRAIENNFVAAESLSQGFSIPLKDSLKVQNVEVRWDFSNAKSVAKQLQVASGLVAEDSKKLVAGVTPKGEKIFLKDSDNVMIQTLPDGAMNTIYGEMQWNYSVKVAKEAYENAFTAVAGSERAVRFLSLDKDFVRNGTDQLGAGAGLFSFSNADYGDVARLWSQYTGNLSNKWIKDETNGAIDAFNPAFVKLQNSAAAGGELGILVTATRRTGEKFKLDPSNPKRLVNKEALVSTEDGLVVDEAVIKNLEASGRKAQFKIENDDTAEFVSQWISYNDSMNDRIKPLITSRGFNFNREPGIFYAPSVDTARYPFFAFVRKKPEFIGASSEVSMITARSEQELRALTGKVPQGEYQVLFDRNTKEFHKAKGDYDYQLTLKDPTVDSNLQRSGVLGDFFPETRAQNVLEDFVRAIQNKSSRFVRYAVETRYAQTIAELKGLGKQFEEIGTSKFGGVLKKFRSQVENPFEDYVKTALDISKRSEYTLLHEANEFAESLGASAYRFFGVNYEKAMAGSMSWKEANRLSQQYGLGAPYKDIETYWKANAPSDRNVLKEFVGKANMTLVNLTLRLDLANSLVNIVSTPILLGTEMASIRSLVAGDNLLAGKLNELRSVALPDGSGTRIPSTTKLIGQSIKSFWSEQKVELLKRYEEIGAVKNMLSQYHEMIEHFAYKPYQKASEFIQKGEKGIEIGAKLSGNEFAEQFTRFVSADVMRQLTDPIVSAGKMSIAEQNAYISVFVNRVQGNYLASQRPIAFQGVLGSAVSLFQTYQFNLLQQLFRHIENRDTRALAVLGGLQSSIYGLNGVPFFEAVNTHLIGNSSLNPQHKDVYSTVPQVLGKELGDWLMYGTASAFPLWSSQSPSLYTRGDINPRHLSIIPISPLDVPAVDGSIRFVKNLVDTGKKLVSGADISSTLLEGLEHNGLSRPLAGIAQVTQGYATTSKGSLISASNDLLSVATLSRVAGAKPVDESIALNSLFRMNAYQAADQAKIQELGEVVKTKLRAGKLPTPEELHEFQLNYAKSGGRIENYARTLQRWNRDANVSVVNELSKQHRSSYSQRMVEIMGGQTLPDYRSQRQLAASVAEAQTSGDTGGTSPLASPDVSNESVTLVP